jgi:tyrosyl-tRNA synthetase
MDIDIKDTISLSDKNEYVVISKTNYENNIYYYLMDIKDNANIKFCVENKNTGNSIIEVTDQTLILTLLPLFLNDANGYLEVEEQ